MKIIKRNGAEETFDRIKIKNAIRKAVADSDGKANIAKLEFALGAFHVSLKRLLGLTAQVLSEPSFQSQYLARAL